MADIKEKLIEATNEGYSNLSKWLIGLATGTIIFSVKLVSPSTSSFLKSLLVFGLGLLVLSIILGIRSVTLRLDGLHYNYLWLENKDRFNENLSNHNIRDSKFEENQKIFKETIDKANKNMLKTSDEVLILYLWQQGLFYVGLVLVSVFAIYSI